MPFDRKIFRILVASPEDVGEERNLKSRKIFEIKKAQKSPNAKNIDSAFIRLIPK